MTSHANSTKVPEPSRQQSAARAAVQPQAPTQLQALHSLLGNRATARWLQAKLEVSAPDDPLEHEADRVAEAVMRMPLAAPATTHSQPGVQRSCAACEEEKVQRQPAGSEALQRAEDARASASSLAGDTQNYVAGLTGRGEQLPQSVRSFMEPRFSADFSAVRVHTDTVADQSARSLQALAYTAGQHIVFRAGQFDPFSQAGQRLLAHELAHTVQQGAAPAVIAPRLAGAEPAPMIQARREPGLQRQADPAAEDLEPEPNFDSPQRRGGRARAAILDAGRRGEDQVRVAVTRYLCGCTGRNVTRRRSSTRLRPNPGVTLEICNGRVTARVTGDLVPSSFSSGRVTVRGEVNVAPEGGSPGVRIGVEGEARNTGNEPQVGGRADARLQVPGGPEVGIRGDIFQGTQSGQRDTSLGAGVGVNIPGLGPAQVGIDVTNPQDQGRTGVQITFGGPLPGQAVEREICRECRCPVVYECVEDIPPRDYEEPVTYEVDDRDRLRYYFKLDTNEDTRNTALRSESQRMLDEAARQVAGGARIVAITGYASPEDNRERPTPNQALALSRAEKVLELLRTRLGASVQLPPALGGGELLGRVATIVPGSRLADAITRVGFGDADDVTAFLFGEDIANPDLAEQFLALLQQVPEPDDRLRLFGVESASPLAVPLLGAIDQFIASRGRGRRPWENIFAYLRYATVELSTLRQDTRMEARRTSGSLTAMTEPQCRPYARAAEGAGEFGPAEPEPQSESQCPPGEARNPPRFANKCDYG